jgi:HK97 family phage prohead protease
MSEKIVKHFTAKTAEINEEKKSVTSVITTDSVDRDGEVVLPGGISLDNFRNNPVVLWAHDYKSAPIGKCVEVKQDSTGLRATTEFANTERGREAFELYKGGFLKGFSIGFIPDRSATGAPTQKELQGRSDWKGAKSIIRKSEMVEYSAVPIPANPQALARAWHDHDLLISKALAQELQIMDTPSETSVTPTTSTSNAPDNKAVGSVARVTAKTIKRSLKKALKQVKIGKVISPEKIKAVIAERLHVARGGV